MAYLRIVMYRLHYVPIASVIEVLYADRAINVEGCWTLSESDS